MPLAVGNSWRYRITVSEENQFRAPGVFIVSNRIDSISVYNSKNWFVFNDNDEKKYLRNFDDGLYSFDKSLEKLFIKFPAEVGDSWSKTDKIIGFEELDGAIPNLDTITVIKKYSIASLNKEITIDNKKYSDCIEIQEELEFDKLGFASNQFQRRTLYYKENIGLIKEEQFINDNNSNIFLVLKKELIENNLN